MIRLIPAFRSFGSIEYSEFCGFANSHNSLSISNNGFHHLHYLLLTLLSHEEGRTAIIVKYRLHEYSLRCPNSPRI